MNYLLVMTSLRQKRIAILAYSLGGLALIVLYTAIFPSLQDQAQSYSQLVATLPSALLKAFNIENSGLSTLSEFLASKHFGLIWPLILMFMSVSLAGWMLAGEVEQGTISLWLAAPVSRFRIFWARYTAAVIALGVTVIGAVLSAIPVAAIFHLPMAAGPMMMLGLASLLLGWAVFSLVLVISALVSEKGRVYALAAAGLMAMYVLNLVASLNNDFNNLKYISLFHYFDVPAIVGGRGLSLASGLVFGALIVVGTGLAAIIFQRRDLSV